jgi:tetratricopeptide (TPR) repeat protein
VEYLLDQYGLDAMKRIFADLARGIPLNEALSKNAASLEQIDREFSTRAQQLANATGAKLNWDKPKPQDVVNDTIFSQWVAINPDNHSALVDKARQLIKDRKWAEAKVPLQRLIELYPDQHESDSAYFLLATAHRELGETDQEAAMLQRVAELSSDATEAYARLIQIGQDRKNWSFVIANAERYAAVNPLNPLPHRATAEANETLGKTDLAIASYETLLKLQPGDATDIHFRLARLLHKEDKPQAKRHVLLALEEAPRFREALQLLLDIDRSASSTAKKASN